VTTSNSQISSSLFLAPSLGDDSGQADPFKNLDFFKFAKVYVVDSNTTVAGLVDGKANTDGLDNFEHQVVQETWNWCANFVVPYNLCPWAAASVFDSENSIQIFLVKNSNTTDMEKSFEHALNLASQVFQRQLEITNSEQSDTKSPKLDPNTAIAFVVQVPDPESTWDFFSFYDWYGFIEEEMIENGLSRYESKYGPLLPDVITWAPFHPEWQYAEDGESEDDDDSLVVEKQTPFPTVTIVSTKIIDRAGEAATEKIFSHNQEVLSAKSSFEWRTIYELAVRQRPEKLN